MATSTIQQPTRRVRIFERARAIFGIENYPAAAILLGMRLAIALSAALASLLGIVIGYSAAGLGGAIFYGMVAAAGGAIFARLAIQTFGLLRWPAIALAVGLLALSIISWDARVPSCAPPAAAPR